MVWRHFSGCAMLGVAMGTVFLATVIALVSGAPGQSFDQTRIYFPDQLDELRTAISYQECKRDPACDPNFLFGIPRIRCSIGEGVDGMFKDMVNTRSSSSSVRKCNPFMGEVIWPATGKCVHLLSQGPCPHGFWVIFRLNDVQPVCDRRPCAEKQALMVSEKKCMPTNVKSNICPQGQELHNNEFGEAECDCSPGTIYHPLTKACYAPYSQGPCPQGQVIKVIDTQNSGNAHCMPHLCSKQNTVMINTECRVENGGPSSANGTCYHLNTQGPCIEGAITIDHVLLEPLCLLQTETHSIFNLPNIKRCARGSIRDSQGRCRRDFSKSFGRLPPFTRPGTVNGKKCARGQILLAGFCLTLSQRTTSRPFP